MTSEDIYLVTPLCSQATTDRGEPHQEQDSAARMLSVPRTGKTASLSVCRIVLVQAVVMCGDLRL